VLGPLQGCNSALTEDGKKVTNLNNVRDHQVRLG
jgi:hypothetical protein